MTNENIHHCLRLALSIPWNQNWRNWQEVETLAAGEFVLVNLVLRAIWFVQALRMHFFVANSVWYLERGPTFSQCNRCSCIGHRASGAPVSWFLGRLLIFARDNLHLRIQWKRHCQQRTLSSEVANILSNVSKRAQFSCQCCTVYLRSATIVTRLTEDDDVIKSLHREAPHWVPHLLGAGPVKCLWKNAFWLYLWIIVVSRARRPSARHALSQSDSRELAIYHGPARGVQLRLDRGRAGLDRVWPLRTNGFMGPLGVASSRTSHVQSPGYPEKGGAVAGEAHVHTSGPGGGQPKRRPGAVRQGPAPFHWKRGRASECQESIWEPYCQSRQAWRRGFKWAARSPRRTAAQTGLYAHIYIVYAHLGGTWNGLLAPQWLAERLHHIWR